MNRSARTLARSTTLGLLGAVSLTGGCVQRTLNISSDPPGALVYMNDQEIGRTPMVRDFTWYGKYDVQIRKEGYQTLNTTMNIVAPPWLWPPFDLLCELAPWHVKDIRNRSYTLVPASTQPADPQALISRADQLRTELQSTRYTRVPTTRPTTAGSSR